MKNKHITAPDPPNRERVYHDWFEHAADLIAVIDIQGRILDLNRRFEEESGYSKTEMIGKNAFLCGIMTPDSVARILFHLKDLLAGREWPIFEVLGVKKDGDTVPYELRAVPIREEGKIVGIHAILRNITERKRSEEALRESERRYRQVVENATEIIYTTDSKGNFTYANEAAIRSCGYSVDELTSINFTDLVLPDRREELLRFYQIQFKERKPSTYVEFPFFSKSGEIRWYGQNASLVLEAGKVKGFHLIARDITARKEAEEALKSSEERFRRMAESIQQGLTIIENRKIVYLNRRISEIMGYPLDELMHMSVFDIAAPEEVPRLKAAMQSAAETKSSPQDLEFWIVRKDGRRRFIRNSYSSGSVPSHALRRYILTADITEERRAKERMRESLREKEILLQEIHHRVKNNMQIISSLMRLQSRRIEDEKILEIYRVSQNRIQSMALIHEMLYQSQDFSRIDFSAYIQRLGSKLLSIYFSQKTDVRLSIEVTNVFLDINQAVPCGLIINELVSNALKHAFTGREQGMIRVRMDQRGDGRCRLSIADNGVGFTPETDYGQPPTLGLQIVNDLAKQLQGTITFDTADGTEIHIDFQSRIKKIPSDT